MSRQNILTDPPLPRDQEIVLESGLKIESIDCLYNPQIFKRSLQCYACTLLIKYILAYMFVPFENIENRPSLAVVTVLYTLAIFTICISLLPFSTIAIPTGFTVCCLITWSILEFIGLLLTLTSTILCLNVDKMYQYEVNGSGKKERVEITLYVQVLCCLALVSNCFSFLFSLVNALCGYKSLSYLVNSIDRRLLHNKAESEVLVQKLSSEMCKSLEKYYNP
ncbi:hypothetical protein CLIB1423_01S09450 [[Candida] railenensis]|uniref:Uncharacterized protein n=1 Tax=[Candida] railenensis TaxID=45579 RepID=A0A9P0QKN2_9ASCO|nr:hypothetical protein CLIB1423_01S09450 [[Candida] railenensis]